MMPRIATIGTMNWMMSELFENAPAVWAKADVNKNRYSGGAARKARGLYTAASSKAIAAQLNDSDRLDTACGRDRTSARHASRPMSSDADLQPAPGTDRHGARAAWRPRGPTVPDFESADAFVYSPGTGELVPVPKVNRVDIGLLRGIDRVRDILLDNTRRFAAGLPANNALLWGARGMGKSSLVKAVHAAINAQRGPRARRR